MSVVTLTEMVAGGEPKKRELPVEGIQRFYQSAAIGNTTLEMQDADDSSKPNYSVHVNETPEEVSRLVRDFVRAGSTSRPSGTDDDGLERELKLGRSGRPTSRRETSRKTTRSTTRSHNRDLGLGE